MSRPSLREAPGRNSPAPFFRAGNQSGKTEAEKHTIAPGHAGIGAGFIICGTVFGISPVKHDSINAQEEQNEEAETGFNEDGYARYNDYAKKQSDAMLNAKYDWNLFERECDALGKVDGVYLLRKSVGAFKPLLDLVS